MSDRRRLFILWFGGHPISPVRERSIDAFRDMGLDVVVLRDEDVAQWEVAKSPMAPAFKLLTPIQRSDYVRAYLMHHHGGGYADIKPPQGSWLPGLQRLHEDSRLWAVGYPIQRWAVSTCGVEPVPRYQPQRLRWWKYRWLQLNHTRILGGGGYAFKPGTPLTERWLTGVEARLHAKTPELRANPGRYAKERYGDTNDGVVSRYPVPWLYLAGDVLHPLAYRYRRHTARVLPMPSLEDSEYQDPRPDYNSGPRDLTKLW